MRQVGHNRSLVAGRERKAQNASALSGRQFGGDAGLLQLNAVVTGRRRFIIMRIRRLVAFLGLVFGAGDKGGLKPRIVGSEYSYPEAVSQRAFSVSGLI
jgi:hypothetical protein